MDNQYFSQDITFCTNSRCTNKSCFRNQCHIRWDVKRYHSFSDFDGTKNCPKAMRVKEADNG